MGETRTAQATLEHYLPYAIAFGVEKSFLRIWEEALEEDVIVWPVWYNPLASERGHGSLADASQSTSIGISAGLTSSTIASSSDASSGDGFSGGGGGGGGGFG